MYVPIKRTLIGATLLLLSVSIFAAGVPNIRLSASRLAVLNDGRDFTEIIAEVRDSSGGLVPDGTQVSFSTNLGVFNASNTVQTRAGSARIKLTSPQKGVATVQVTVIGAAERIDVTFTDNPEETFQGNAYISVQSNDANLYSAPDRMVEADGRKRPEDDKGFPGAHLSYRNTEIFADRIQLDCTNNTVKATGGVTIRRGSHRLRCARLYYLLTTGDGYAIAEIDKRLRPVQVKGSDLKIEPFNGVIPESYLLLKDLTDANLVITAQQVLVFPGDRIQFKRPTIYQNSQKLVSMPFYQISLYSTQLFTDQILTVGTQGLGVDIPIYYDMSPSSAGIFSIRHGERNGRSSFNTRPGWSLDMNQTYNSVGAENRYTGQLGLTGISRSDWGVRWNHSHEFAGDTRASMFLDFPQHRSVFGSTNINKPLGPFYLGFNLSGNSSFTGYSASGLATDVYLETVPKKVSRTGYMYALGATSGYSFSRAGSFTSQALTQGVQARFYSSPFRLNKETTLTNSLTVGDTWGTAAAAGTAVLASLNMTRTFKGSNLQVGYDFTKQPIFYTGGGNHRLNFTYLANGGPKWSLFTYASTMLDAPSSSVIADLSYLIMPRWRISFAGTFQRFLSGQYRDYELGIGRTIAGRELRVSYSTYNHRFFFDIEASRF